MKAVVKLIAIFPALILVLVGALLAQEKSFPPYSGHINDFAQVMDPATRETLETILHNFEVRTGAQIAVVTVNTLGDRPIEDYALALYRAWGIGAKTGENKNKGALLLVATADRRSRLEVGYGLEGDLPDGLAGEMLRRMRPLFREQKWSEGLTVGVRTLVDTLAQKWNVSLEGIDQSFAYSGPSKAAEGESLTPVGFFVGLIFVVILLITIVRLVRRGGGGGRGTGLSNMGWIGPLIFNQGGGSFGGGGSGGSSGGDWGGFGGGSSGGGGASDSW